MARVLTLDLRCFEAESCWGRIMPSQMFLVLDVNSMAYWLH